MSRPIRIIICVGLFKFQPNYHKKLTSKTYFTRHVAQVLTAPIRCVGIFVQK